MGRIYAALVYGVAIAASDKDKNVESRRRNNKFIVGVTGGIGSGKSAATARFEQLGVVVVDADIVAREVVQPGSVALKEIADAFGSDFILDNGELNRSLLRAKIFSPDSTDNSAKDSSKDTLNKIMQPKIRDELIKQLTNANSPYVVLSAPLLFENQLQSYCDITLVIDVDEATQIARASSRDNVNKAQIQAIISSQIERDKRVSLADYVVTNHGTLEELNYQIDQLHKKYLTLAGG
jgi:dephospho-CoA kinase